MRAVGVCFSLALCLYVASDRTTPAHGVVTVRLKKVAGSR